MTPATVSRISPAGISLNNVACNNDNEFVTRIVHNNYKDPNSAAPDYSRIHVKRVTDLQRILRHDSNVQSDRYRTRFANL